MSKKLLKDIISNLDDNKAKDITSIPLEGKSDIADHLVIATGTSSRHVSSLAQRIVTNLKEYGLKSINAEGLEKGDWVLICLLYTSPSPRDRQKSRMPSSA